MSESNIALTRRWFEEVWNQGRLEAIDEMAAADVIGHGQAQHGTQIGREQFRQFATNMRAAFPDVHATIHDAIAQGDRVVVRWTATMTHKGDFMGLAPTGRKVTIQGISIQRIADGKIAEGWDNWDQLGLLVQVGAMKEANFLGSKAGT